MFPDRRFVRHHKRQSDRAISQAYRRLAQKSIAAAPFTDLLLCVRARSARLFDAPVINDRHLGIEAIFNLSRFADAFVRPITNWAGSTARWRGATSSLAQHMLGRYDVAGFLGSAWYGVDDAGSEAERHWFIAHAAGRSFRSLDLPIEMTRRMEHIFLNSPDHLGIRYAMRRAELLALGASDQLADAVLATRVGTDLTHSAFWRAVWRFLIANASAIDIGQVGPLIDFLHSIRHERVPVETPTGRTMREPPQPDFSMRGRTPRSLLRLIDQWHRGLGRVTGGLSWEPSRLRPMILEIPREDPDAPPLRWEFTELTNSAQLRAEGAALRHCVASYDYWCWRGGASIWSLRSTTGSKARPILTIEVDRRRRAIVQARGFRNRQPSGKALRLLHSWAARESLRIQL